MFKCIYINEILPRESIQDWLSKVVKWGRDIHYAKGLNNILKSSEIIIVKTKLHNNGKD